MYVCVSEGVVKEKEEGVKGKERGRGREIQRVSGRVMIDDNSHNTNINVKSNNRQ